MSNQNKILTTLNEPLGVQLYSLETSGGVPIEYTTLSGLPLGTHNNASDGEIGVKVIQIGEQNQVMPGFEIPEHDDIVLAYYGATNNIQTVTYKLEGATVATLTLTYTGGGAADDDRLIRVLKS